MELAKAVRDETAMAMRVLGRLARDDNLAVSPLSLHAALTLLGAGARGATLDQIVAFLGPAGGPAHAALASHVALRSLADSAPGGGENEDRGGPKVRFANGIWVDSALRLKAAYARVVADKYRAEARPVSFRDTPEEARRQINEWFKSATAGRIKDFLPERAVDSETPAVLGNALYFKGAWESKFDARSTRDDVFYLPNGRHAFAQFMSSGKRQYIACRAGYKVLRLPYARGHDKDRLFAMYIYLPDERHGLPDMLRRLCSDPALIESSDTLTEKVPVGAFRVPRFTLSYKMNAAALLQDLGLRLPFEYPAADLSEMVESAPERIVVSAVYHESLVEVNEEGTEAAAATAVVMSFGCAWPVHVVDFVADHPFMFLIKEDISGVVVFAGLVTNPSASS
ncbi:hypothetical protein E2562_002979 [Oryza meyeriana var. granulata]|uniref:Serpin domain-containing protein n=1 Tax=Oryza meyeriana var. granulata TaxID=110450 RepID=A0A6G1DDM2_9ORYZ|nr:hypothetical protein E2562_002979 [Oryza meyeriana var. granulata]